MDDSKFFLRKRSYHNELPNTPLLSSILKEWIFTLNIFKNKEAFGAWIWVLHILFCGCMFMVFFTCYFNIKNSLVLFALLLVQANFFHTFWYHRYASHKAFKFSHPVFPVLIKWLNSMAIKEEIYVIPHAIHHRLSDSVYDPYGPHLGAIGSFLSPESQNYFNREMDEKSFNTCLKLMNHLPGRYANYEEFKTNGYFEPTLDYLFRVLFMLSFWYFLFAVLLQSNFLFVSFFAASFLMIVIVRDFNFRGHHDEEHHKSPPIIDKNSNAINQNFYGILASEWHENHHRFSSSARCGFEKWQLDISFLITKLFYKICVIESYHDSSDSYQKEVITHK